MEKNVILQVVDEGDCLHFQFEGEREQVFEVIGSVVEALHYEDIKRGRCVKDSMCDIRIRVMSAIRKAFRKAHERCREEKNNEKSKDCD